MSNLNHTSSDAPQLHEQAPRGKDSTWIWVAVLLALIAVCGVWVLSQSGERFNPTRQAEVTTPVTPGSNATTATDSDDDTVAGRSADATASKSKTSTVAAAKRTPTASRPLTRDARPLAGNPAPQYPRNALRAGNEGTVLVRAEVDAAGVPTELELTRRSGDRELDRAALNAVRGWRFDPAMENGRAVASAVQVPIEFVASNR